MKSSFDVLIISDSHIGQPLAGVDANTVFDQLFTDIENVGKDNNLTPDLIVYSGDIAFGNHPDLSLSQQYDLAEVFINQIYSKLKAAVGDIPILMVPGNHDIDRSKITPALNEHRDNLNKSKVDLIMSSSDRLGWTDYIRRQSEWYIFLLKMANKQNGNFKIEIDDTYYTTSLSLEHNGISIGVVGLNTSWASYKQDEKNKLWIGKHQYQKAYDKVKNAAFKIAISHHPVHWMNAEETSYLTQKLSSQFNVHIHGHEHSQWIVDTDNHLKLEAGSCYQGSDKENSYSWLSIDFNNKSGRVYLRGYNDAGAGGWCPKIIPKVTDNNGVAEVKHFIADSHLPLNINNPSIPIQAKAQIKPLNLIEYIRLLEDQFKFRWEPHNFNDSNDCKTRIYWPVKLRQPTPIHASQCFTAAGLQRYGCEICLCIDNLGNTTYAIHDFETKLKDWFTRAGGDANLLVVHNFKEILDRKHNYAWDMVGRWLGNRHYMTDKVLYISKIAKSLDFDEETIQGIRKFRPRRLLTPAMVWACLLDLHMQDQSIPIVTLGGYDERDLWKAWQDCNQEITTAKIGHLYVPALKQYENSSTSAIYMKERPLDWTSKRDIEDDLSKDIISSESNIWLKHERMIPWCVNNCVLLPSIIKEGNPEISIKNIKYSSLAELREVNPSECLTDIVGEVYKWLLA